MVSQALEGSLVVYHRQHLLSDKPAVLLLFWDGICFYCEVKFRAQTKIALCPDLAAHKLY